MSAQLPWIRKLAEHIPEMREVPLFGKAPPFEWNELSSALGALLGSSSFKLEPFSAAFCETEELKKGLQGQILSTAIAITPLGTVFWMIDQEDMKKLSSHLLNNTSSEILQEGFYRYLLLEALAKVQTMRPFSDLTLQLSEEQILDERAFCIDVKIGLDSFSCWGRLAIPLEFRSLWVEHFEKMPSEYVPNALSSQLLLQLGVKTGSILLQQSDWQRLETGDFIALDRGSYDPRKETGIALLMLGATPLFNVKIKQNKLELLDYAFYYEETMKNIGQNIGDFPEEPSQEAPAEAEVVAIKELPLYINVEIARLKITLEKLMSLSPGNVLELPIHPDQSVSLIVNGQKVGRGELVYLGETLGLRILEIG